MEASVVTISRLHRVGRIVARASFALWIGLAMVVGSTLMAGHWSPLPTPDPRDSGLATRLAQLRRPAMVGRWHAVHVLYADCRCSERVLEHLFDSPRPANVAETILFVVDDVGDDSSAVAPASAAGIDAAMVTREDLARSFHIEAAPLLIVLDPDDAIRYVGGYSYHKQDPVIRDVEIITDLERSQPPRALPVYGCAVSRRLQTALDPLGVRYR